MKRQFLARPSIDKIKTLLERRDLATLRALLSQYHPADIADVLERLDAEKAVAAFRLLPNFEASEVLDEANSLLTAELIEKVDDERLADLLDTLPMDDAAELLEEIPDEASDKLLELMEPEERREVKRILSYPERSAGRLMTQDVAVLRAQWTVAQAFDYLRALRDAETLHHLYTVDVVGRLTGVVPIRNLVLAQADTTIGAIAMPNILSVSAETDQEALADLMSRYDYTAIPVVDDEMHLLGVVTVDDALDVIEEEITEDIQQLGGSSPLEQPYFSVSIGTMVRKRVGWLLLLFFASSLSGSVVALFNTRLDATIMATLTIFFTLVIGTGGNAGSQTVATVIRALAIEEVRFSDLGRTLRREVSVGFVMGILLGIIGYVFAMLYAIVQPASITNPSQVALVIALTLPVVVMWSTCIATLIPILAEKYAIDATVVSAPMITTVVDATGLLIYYSLALLILG
ncbi:MAG: magnesium transporter [Candidatus Promineifilaceae bacterium]